MRFLALAFLAVCLVLSLPAQAQEVFIKKADNTKAPNTKVLDLSPMKEDEAQQQETNPAQKSERTSFSKDMLDKFYENCKAHPNAILSEESQDMFCACTAEKTAEEMSVEEIETMFKPTASGQAMRNRMLIRVYTPCMEFPTHDLVYKTCLEDRAISQNLKKPKAVCECLAKDMAEFVVEKAPGAITAALQLNNQDLDPLGMMLNSHGFDSQSQSVMTKCLYEHEYGWK